MLASKIIEELQEKINQYGDFSCGYWDDWDEWGFNDIEEINVSEKEQRFEFLGL